MPGAMSEQEPVAHGVLERCARLDADDLPGCAQDDSEEGAKMMKILVPVNVVK